MKKFILFFFALVANVCAFAQGTADFNTLKVSTSYAEEITTADGWVINYSAVQGGVADPSTEANPQFALLGSSTDAVAVCLNGHTAKVGRITSPKLEGGIGNLSFNYGRFFNDDIDFSLKVEVLQNEEVVFAENVTIPKHTKCTYKEGGKGGEITLPIKVAGDFVLVITNNCPSQKASNGDRISLWNLSWTAQAPLPESPLVFSDVVDGGVYAIVNVQPLDPVKFFVLESVDGELTAQSADKLDGNTKYAETAQYKAIELEDGRFAFQNVATGDYLAWRNHQANGGIDGNRGFYSEINECTSWTMNGGTQFPGLTTYWFYAGNRSDTNKNPGTLILSNAGDWNAWSATECTNAAYSNNFGFVACATEVDFEKVNVAAIKQADFVEEGKWYLLKQKRGPSNTVLVTPVHDEGVGATMKRAAKDDVVVAGTDALDAVDYLLRFIPTENEGAYNLQFANGHYWANTMTTTEEEPGEYNVYNINGAATHIGINLYNMNKIVDNNGAGNTLAFWESGEVTKLDGNNDWTVWEVEFAEKSTAAADLKALIKEVEAAYALNNVAEVGEGIITTTDQFSSPYTCGQDMEPGSGVQNLLDMDGKTYWHSDWSSAVDSHFHYLQVEFTEPISGEFEFNMNRRVNGSSLCANDNPVKMSVETSLDGEEFVLADEFETPFTQTAAAPLVQATVNIPTPAKYLRFFNDESNGDNQRGYWHCGDLQLKPLITPALNVTFAEAAAALQEAIAAAKEVGASATDADVAALQAAYEAYVAALNAPVVPEPTPVTFEFTDNEDGTITITPSDLEALYFFNIYSDRLNTEYQQGTDAEAIAGDVAQNLTAPESEVHTGVSVVDPAAWLQYWFGGYVQYTAGDYRLGVVELAYDGTYSMAGEPVFHAFTKAADEPVVEEKYALNFDKALEQKADDRHVTGFKLNDQVVEFPAYNTVYLDATDIVMEVNAGEELQPAIVWDGAWMHGIVYVDLDNDGSFYEEGDLVAHSPYTGNQNLATTISAFTAPAKAGEYRMRVKTDWVGDSQHMDGGGLDPAGRIGDDGTMTGNNSIWSNRGRIIDLVLKVVADEPETFPMEGVAYKFKNVDSQLYIKVVEDAEQCVTLGQTPDEMYFTAIEGGWTISNSKGYQLGSTAKGWNIGNTATPIVWTIEEVEGGYAFHNEKGYLGFDTAAAGMKAFRDKSYTANHGVFNIWKYDEEEIIVVPDKTLEETWENIHTLLAEAEAIKELNEVTVTYDSDGYFEDFTSPIVGKVGYKKHDDVWAVCDGADYVNSFVNYFETAAEADAYLADFGGLAALEEIITNVIDDYNAAEVVLPEPGKTYVIRNYPYTYSDEYSYAYYFNGEKLALSEAANATTAEYMWTVSEPVKYSYFDADLNVIEETRYQFVNAADNTKFMSWRGNGTDNYAGVTTNASDANSKWYLTGKKVDGTGAHAYGTLALRTNADGNQYRTAVVDMRKSTDHLGKSNGDHFDATYSSWFIFEEVEIPVTEWNGSEPIVTVEDDTTVKVTFTDAHSVEATNYGVLAAVYDEQGDVVAIAFNSLFDDTVEYGTDCATIHFKKISEIRAELAESVKAAAAKISAAIGGADVKGKVVIAGKSFKLDGEKIYSEVIVADILENGGNVTGIEGISFDKNAKVYDLQGRRVAAPRKGVQIINGVKVVR